jgi:vancomycin resistance protein VanJ
MMNNAGTVSQLAPKRIHWALKILEIVFDTYAIVLILFLALMLITPRPWFVEMLCNLLDWALLPSVPLLIILIVLRRWRSLVIWSIPAIAFMILFGGLFLPALGVHKASENNASNMHLRMMTWNLYGMVNVDRHSQIEILRNSSADIITLQEVTAEIVPLIETELSELYPYRILAPGGPSGTGLLSKYPIESEDVFLLPPSTLNNCKAVLNLNGVSITVICAHPPPPLSFKAFNYKSSRSVAINEIIQIASQSHPVLVMGDFNISDQSTIYKLIPESGLKDTFREAGWGFGPTWPVRFHGFRHFSPVVRLDYIWHSKEFMPISIKVGQGAISDHLPVIADLILQVAPAAQTSADHLTDLH